MVVFSYVVPSVWHHPIAEQLIISVVSVLVTVVLRRTQGWHGLDSLMSLLTGQAQHLKVLSLVIPSDNSVLCSGLAWYLKLLPCRKKERRGGQSTAE